MGASIHVAWSPREPTPEVRRLGCCESHRRAQSQTDHTHRLCELDQICYWAGRTGMFVAVGACPLTVCGGDSVSRIIKTPSTLSLWCAQWGQLCPGVPTRCPSHRGRWSLTGRCDLERQSAPNINKKKTGLKLLYLWPTLKHWGGGDMPQPDPPRGPEAASCSLVTVLLFQGHL